MTPAVHSVEIARFRAVVARRLGLAFEEARLPFLHTVLRGRIEADGRSEQAYLGSLEDGLASAELSSLAEQLTVSETYFFRNLDQFRAFGEICLPERLRVRSADETRRLRLLSAGCASGEEAYSLAILVREQAPAPAWEVSILGVDVNPVVLATAARARYSPWALRETPPEVQRRWFRAEGRDAVLETAIRQSVRFEERNLNDDNPGLWLREAYDVVFCRNVLMYLTPTSAGALVARIAGALAPGGYLFLGHAEALRGLSDDFHVLHTHGTFYYQRKGSVEPPGDRPTHVMKSWWRSAPGSIAIAPARAVIEHEESWVDAIRRASERIQALVESPRTPAVAATAPAAAPAPAVSGARPILRPAMELLRRERFEDALVLIDALHPDASRDPDVLLLRAVLLNHGGKLAEAEQLCRQLIQLREVAGAHHVLALCREAVGDSEGATSEDELALHLDPSFAMARLHLGLLARRGRALELAQVQLGQALLLLEREDAARLLLFGGGFAREALIALCRAELVATSRRS